MAVFPLVDCRTEVDYRGVTVDKVTRAVLIAAEDRLGYPLTVMQGGFRPQSSFSGTTHTRGGVGDLAAYDWHNKCEVLNSLGCYAYHRPYVQGLWGEHIHFGVIDHLWRDPALVAQQLDWLHNPPLNGLLGHMPYAGPHPGHKIVFPYDPATELELKPMTPTEEALDELVRAAHNVSQGAALINEGDKAKGQIPKLKRIHKDLRDVIKVVKAKV